MYDHVFSCMGMYGCVWLRMIMYDHEWAMIVYIYVWLFGYVWLWMTTYDFVIPSPYS